MRGQQLKYYLSESLQTAYWNTITQRALKGNRAFPEYPEFNARLDIPEHTIKNTYRKYRNNNDQKIPSPEELKELLDIATEKTRKSGLPSFPTSNTLTTGLRKASVSVQLPKSLKYYCSLTFSQLLSLSSFLFYLSLIKKLQHA